MNFIKLSKSLSRRNFLKKSAGVYMGTLSGLSLSPLLNGCNSNTKSVVDGDLDAVDAADMFDGDDREQEQELEHEAEAVELPEPRNIVLITADDLGWFDLSCYGNEDIQTGHIDSLSNSGVTFDNAFVTSSSCSPSRASLLTGQYPHTNGVDGLTNRYPEKALPKGSRTLASVLKDKGMVTGIQGKWHIAGYSDKAVNYGYDESLSNIVESVIEDSSRAIDFIERHKDERFYLELNYMNNHRTVINHDFEFDPEFPVDPDSIHVPEWWNLPDWPEIRLELAKYYSQTLKMDKMIGQVLSKLEELGLNEDTLVVFLSDNGPPFPGLKMTLYDRGIGTPLMIQWPAALPKGARVPSWVSLVDVMPTLLELMKIDIPDDLQGYSFANLLIEKDGEPIRDAIFSEMTYHVNYLPSRSIRYGQWKYIHNYSDLPVGLDQLADVEWAERLVLRDDQPWTRPKIEHELYDLENDPQEQNNLANNPEFFLTLTDLQARLGSHMKETGDPFLNQPFTKDYVED